MVVYSHCLFIHTQNSLIMNAVIKDGNLIITLPVNPNPSPSASGKTLVVASSSGNKATAVIVNGKPVTIGVNAYIAKD